MRDHTPIVQTFPRRRARVLVDFLLGAAVLALGSAIAYVVLEWALHQ